MVSALLGNVYVRIGLYIMSTVPGLLAGAGIGWITIRFDGADWLTVAISLKGLGAMITSAVGLSGGIFAKFGKK